MRNLAYGKSESTITWYGDMMKLFTRYLKENRHTNRIEEFNAEISLVDTPILTYNTLDFRHRLFGDIFVDSKHFPLGYIENNTPKKTSFNT